MELKTVKFIKENNNWKEILSAPPYSLTIKEDKEYYLLKYNQLESDFSIDIVKECRGLIIDKKLLIPVALSFTKFFNIEEPNANRISWSNCRVQEKVDGAKILVWYNRNKWHVSTSGNIDAYTTMVGDLGFSYGQLFDEAVLNLKDANHQQLFQSTDDFLTKLNPLLCYTFELISPKARIVIAYKQTEIRFIGLRNVIDMEELNPDEDYIATIVKRPKEFPIVSAKDCMDKASKLGLDQEGFVVVDYRWRRVKVKSPLYIKAHYLKNNSIQSKGRLLGIIESNEQDEFLSYFPEWTEDINRLLDKRELFKSELYRACTDVFNYANGLDRNLPDYQKIVAQYIMTHYEKFQAFIFKILKIDLLSYYIDGEWGKLSNDKKLEHIGEK